MLLQMKYDRIMDSLDDWYKTWSRWEIKIILYLVAPLPLFKRSIDSEKIWSLLVLQVHGDYKEDVGMKLDRPAETDEAVAGEVAAAE